MPLRTFTLPAAIILAGLCCMLLSFASVCHTHDELGHLACGLELWETGGYEIEAQHPPLPRLASALLPYLKGLRLQHTGELFQEGWAILISDGEYSQNLFLSRLGMLPFYVAACLGMLYLLWPLGPWVRNSALVLLAFSPNMLAHAGLATTDGACAAFYVLSVAALANCMETRKKRHFWFLALFFALGLLSKHSFLFFFLPTALLSLLYARWRGKSCPFTWKMALGGFLLLFFCCWAAYNFSLGPIWTPTSLAAQWKPDLLPPWLKQFLATHSFPFPEYFRGILEVLAHDADGHKSFFLGTVRDQGHPLFFLVSLLVKTPLVTLACFGAGVYLRLRLVRKDPLPRLDLALLAFATVLGVASFSSINIGVRHVLPLFPFLAALGGYGLATLLARKKTVIVLVLCLHVAVSLLHFPGYIGFHNALAAPFAEKVSVDSNLDWGQHQYQFSEYLDAHPEITSIHLDPLLKLTAWLQRDKPLHMKTLAPETPVHGYVAIRLHSLKTYSRYAWLRDYEPIAVIGKTIYVFDTSREARQKN